MRKFVRNYAGQGRSDGDYHMPVMRLADVYLMYAEVQMKLMVLQVMGGWHSMWLTGFGIVVIAGFKA